MIDIEWHESPNRNARPHGIGPSVIVLHADASSYETGTIDWVTRAESRVSYHYLIGRTGKVYQFVKDERRAWHAGVSAFGGIADVNDYSLGVCFSNNQRGETFTDEALAAGVALCADLCKTHEIDPSHITTHAIIALPKGRKHDPGPRFPMADFLTKVEEAIL